MLYAESAAHAPYFVLQLLGIIGLICLNIVHHLVAKGNGLHEMQSIEVVVPATQVAKVENVVVAVIHLLQVTMQGEENLHFLHGFHVGFLLQKTST